MKKLYYILLIASFSSCSIIPKTLYVGSVSIVDYTPYSDKGFFITESNSVSFEYTPVSSVMAVFRSGYASTEVVNTENKQPKSKHSDDVYSGQSASKRIKTGDFIESTPQSVLEELYRKSVEIGANGIINLKISSFTEGGIDNLGKPITLIGYTASGMAIKR